MTKTFSNYLWNNKRKNNSVITHTRIGNKDKNIHGGSYTIQDDDKDFYDMYYQKVFVRGKKEYLTEKQIPDGQILIDLDFRFSPDVKRRKVNDNNVEEITLAYTDIIKNMYEIPVDTAIPLWVLRKPNVNCLEDKTKDGLHIVIGLSATAKEQLYIREKMIERADDIFYGKPLQNSYDDVFDKGISTKKTNWQMYGSQKPGNERYEIIEYFELSYDGDNFDWHLIEDYDERIVLEKISARNKNIIKVPLKSDIKELLTETKQQEEEKVVDNEVVNDVCNNIIKSKTPFEKLEKIANLVNAKKRLVNYSSWQEFLYIVHYESNGSKEGYDLFMKCSRKAPGYNNIQDSEHIDRWNSANKNNTKQLTIATLINWIQEDDPEAWQIIIDENRKWIDITHHDIATIIYKDIGHKFCCIKTKKKVSCDDIYYFNGNVWDTSAYSHFVKYLTEKVFKSLNKVLQKMKHKLEPLKYIQHTIALKSLKNKSFVKSSYEMFISTLKLERSVSIPFNYTEESRHYVQFKNGCFDLRTGEFRKRTPEDYITMTLDYDYKYIPLGMLAFTNIGGFDFMVGKENNVYESKEDYEMEVARWKNKIVPPVKMVNDCNFWQQDENKKYYDIGCQIIDDFRKIQTETDNYRALWHWNAYCLSGETNERKFYYWVGHTACNGKTTIQEILNICFPIYFDSMNKDTFALKTSSSDKNKELARLVERPLRCVYINDTKTKQDEATIKTFVDGVPFSIRCLYKEAVNIPIQAKLTMSSNVEFSSGDVDNGILRRGLQMTFDSQFKKKEKMTKNDTLNPKVFPMDQKLVDKYNDVDYKLVMFALLADICKRVVYGNKEDKEDEYDDVVPSEKFNQAFRDSLTDGDLFGDFMNQHFIEGKGDDCLSKAEIIDLVSDNLDIKVCWNDIKCKLKARGFTYSRTKKKNKKKGCFLQIKTDLVKMNGGEQFI